MFVLGAEARAGRVHQHTAGCHGLGTIVQEFSLNTKRSALGKPPAVFGVTSPDAGPGARSIDENPVVCGQVCAIDDGDSSSRSFGSAREFGEGPRTDVGGSDLCTIRSECEGCLLYTSPSPRD